MLFLGGPGDAYVRGPSPAASTRVTASGRLTCDGRPAPRALVWVDNRGVDGAVNGLAATLGGSSSRLGRAQTGFVRSYALGMLGGAVVLAGALLAMTAG